MTPPLFSPFELGPVRLNNRIVVSPMCQYSATDGSATDWHLQHLAAMAMSGAGLMIMEATAAERRGRITHGCLGLYSDANEYALGRALALARAVALPGTRFGIQIAHAGRKGSTRRPWEGGTFLEAGEDPWPVPAPSPIPFNEGWPAPDPLDEAGIRRVRLSFLAASRRAVRLGFEVIELHMAHGYLLHQFHSPLANARADGYGGGREGRMRLLLEVAREVRAAVPEDVAVGARITGSDWLDGGLDESDAVLLARALKEIGLAYVCVTSGGIVAAAPIKVGPGFQVPFAHKVREDAGIATCAVGMIVTPEQANEIVVSGAADMVALARAFLDNPRWGWHAADALGAEMPRPPQYDRVNPRVWPGVAMLRGPGGE